MLGEGEVIIGGAHKVAKGLGLEIASPRALRKRGEFPDCNKIFVDLVSGGGPTIGEIQRYIWLCRVTAFAWLAWSVIAASLWVAGWMWFYHWLNELQLATHVFYPPVKCVTIVLFFCGTCFGSLLMYAGLLFFAEQFAEICRRTGPKEKDAQQIRVPA